MVSIAAGACSRSAPRPKTRNKPASPCADPKACVLPIAIDVMSGDHEPREYVAGALRALSDDPQLCAQLVGEPQLITAALAPLSASVPARATVVAASQAVATEHKPPAATRARKDSSIPPAVPLVHAR